MESKIREVEETGELNRSLYCERERQGVARLSIICNPIRLNHGPLWIVSSYPGSELSPFAKEF